MSKGTCNEPGCERPVTARGLCNGCYQRLRRTGKLEKRPVWRPSPAVTPQPIVMGSPVLPDRFWRHVSERDSGCWGWSGGIDDKGYGHFVAASLGIGRMRRSVHVWAYEAFIGPVPPGLVLDHQCHNNDAACTGGASCKHRACCNPDHLEPTTTAENFRRGRRGGVTRTHCPAGHPYQPPHVQHDRDGYSDCRTCRNRRMRERYWARKAQGQPTRHGRPPRRV